VGAAYCPRKSAVLAGFAREGNLMLADLNVREETEVCAYSYKACLLGLGLWFIHVGFGARGKRQK